MSKDLALNDKRFWFVPIDAYTHEVLTEADTMDEYVKVAPFSSLNFEKVAEDGTVTDLTEADLESHPSLSDTVY